jgi:hypothetical protein
MPTRAESIKGGPSNPAGSLEYQGCAEGGLGRNNEPPDMTPERNPAVPEHARDTVDVRRRQT